MTPTRQESKPVKPVDGAEDGRRVGGEWAERGGDTELQNIQENVKEAENVQTPEQKTRDGWELGGGWAEAGRKRGGAGRRH